MKVFPFILSLGLILSVGCEQSNKKENRTVEQEQNENNMNIKKENTDDKFSSTDTQFFKHCLALAQKALDAGDQPFGSILVNAENEVIAEARNRINEKNVLAHPEIELAEWAIDNLSLEERRAAKMYTTGEHCPMCAGAHAWSQIGELYYLSSAKQLGKWLTELGVDPAPIEFIPSEKIMKNVKVKGPVQGNMLEEIKQMHEKYYQQ